MSPELFLGLYVFMLAGFIGYGVITGVPPLLHTPLMAFTNAISGISLVGSIVAAGAVVLEGKSFPPHAVIAGVPGKQIAERDSSKPNRMNAWQYHRNAEAYRRGDHRAWDGPEYDAWLKAKLAEIEADRDR